MIYFTSDTHFGHTAACGHRGFDSTDEMDACIVRMWRSVVRPRDIVYHLGDVTFRPPKQTREIFEQLPGRKILVAGNHDYKRRKHLAEFFEEIHDLITIRFHRQKIVLCHFPLLTWDSRHHGAWHLHGHSHGSLKVDPNVARRDVGFEISPYPISMEQIYSDFKANYPAKS